MEPQYETRVENDVFLMTFQAPRQLLLHPEFEAMVHDECLRQAHSQGVMPVGPILIEHSEIEAAPTSELREGETLKQRMERWQADHGAKHVAQGFAGAAQVDLIKVTASVSVGLAL